MKKTRLQKNCNNSTTHTTTSQQKPEAKQLSDLGRVTCECWGFVGNNPTWLRFWQELHILWSEERSGACIGVHKWSVQQSSFGYTAQYKSFEIGRIPFLL